MTAHIAIIDPAVNIPAMTAFNNLVRLSPLPLTYHLPFLHGITPLLSIEQETIAGIIVLGSNTSVNNTSLYQDLFISWLEKFIDRQLPIFGICYGHQLLSTVFGGRAVFHSPTQEKLNGFRVVNIHDDQRLAIERRQQQLVVSHNEIVTEIPRDFEVFADSELLAYEGLRHKQLPIWTLQPHPEATQEFLYNQQLKLTLPAVVQEQGFALVASFIAYCAQGRSNR